MNITTIYAWFCITLSMICFASICSEKDPRSPKSPLPRILTAEQQLKLEEDTLEPIYVSNASSIYTASVTYTLPSGNKHFELDPKKTVNLPATVTKITARFAALGRSKTKYYPSCGDRVRLTHSASISFAEKKVSTTALVTPLA